MLRHLSYKIAYLHSVIFTVYYLGLYKMANPIDDTDLSSTNSDTFSRALSLIGQVNVSAILLRHLWGSFKPEKIDIVARSLQSAQ